MGSLNGESAEKDAETGRLPAIARLGPLILHDEEVPSEPPANPLVAKRKPGRPPGIRGAQANIEQVPVTTSRKRKAPQDKPPTGEKKSGSETVKGRKVSKTIRNRRGTPRSSHTQSTPTSSENLPIANMIPPAARRRMDFQAPSNPVP